MNEQPKKSMHIVGIIIGSLFLTVAVEWLGMVFLWPEQGAQHAQRMLTTEVQYLNSDFVTASNSITSLSSLAYRYTVGYIEPLLIWFGYEMGLEQFTGAAIASIQLFFVRVIILTFSIPVFILFLIVGVSSGLALRDIRRWSGGREYGGVYHRAKWIAPKALLSAWVIYLAIPISIHPTLIILPCAMLFGLNILIVSSSFKKYL